MTSSRVPQLSEKATGTLSTPTDSERLRHFCLAILNTLDQVEGIGVTPDLPGALLRSIGAGVEEVASELRQEVNALAAVVADLRALPTRYLSLPPAAAALLAELEGTQAQATQLANALDAIRSAPVSSFLKRTIPSAPSDGNAQPHAVDTQSTLQLTEACFLTSPEIAESTSGNSSTHVPVLRLLPDTTKTHAQAQTEATTPLSNSTQRAGQVFREGERYRKQRELERAEELYSEAISIDHRFGPAYSRRGQVRLARRAITDAIADFNAALALDETAAEAWWWRGDAHAITGHLDEAIADYTRALALRPDLERVQLNLAVAKRRKNELSLVPEPSPSPVETSTTPAPTPTSRSLPPANKKNGGQLTVSCPHCGEIGEVPWDRLGKVFACKGCDHRFGVGADGKAVELTETPGGKWVESRKIREQAQRRRKRRLVGAAVLGFAVLFPAIGFAGWQVARPAPTSNAEIELPKELETRAELFCRGWLTNDVRLMKRLTSPAHEKIVYAWYNRHRPPLPLRGNTEGVPKDTRFEIQVQSIKPGQSRVRVRVSNPTLSPAQPPVELSLVWEERLDGWYVLPPNS